MARGGKRAGSGRPKGVRNRNTNEIIKAAAAHGLTPLDYMLGELNNPNTDIDRRDRLAAAAAPYLHPRLQSVQHSGSVTVKTFEQRLEELDKGT